MDEYISREATAKAFCEKCKGYYDGHCVHRGECDIDVIKNAPAADVQPVGRCKDCIYFKPAHVRYADGSEKAYSEFPEEAFEPNFGLGVTNEYGINVGSQCVYDEWCGGYIDDKTVFRKEDDFCSRFKSGGRKDGDE